MIGSPPEDFYKPSAAKRARQRRDGIALLVACVVFGLWIGSLWLNSGPR
jgi:hypothetical protein